MGILQGLREWHAILMEEGRKAPHRNLGPLQAFVRAEALLACALLLGAVVGSIWWFRRGSFLLHFPLVLIGFGFGIAAIWTTAHGRRVLRQALAEEATKVRDH